MSKHEITSLSVTNYKGVREITVEPEGRSLVVIAGGNAAGKSSFIDGIAELFAPGGTRLTPKPIRDGESEAVAEVTTDSARIVRRWKKNDAGTLDTFAVDGAKYPSGKQFVLDATGGALLDPKAFTALAEKDQRDQLLARVELPFDLAALDADRKAALDGRTEVSRDVKRLTAVRASLQTPAEGTPTEEVSAAGILAEADQAREHNTTVIEARHRVNVAKHTVADLADQMAELQSQLDAAEVELRTVASVKIAEPIDLDAITARLSEVEATNDAVRAGRQVVAADAELAESKAAEDALTAKIAVLDKKKRDGLASANFPDPLLSVDDEGITYDGVPFRQVNSAKQVVIAMRLLTLDKPDLRLLIIKDGDTLDDATLAEVDALANESGYLVLAERDRNHERQVSAHVIEDGSVKA